MPPNDRNDTEDAISKKTSEQSVGFSKNTPEKQSQSSVVPETPEDVSFKIIPYTDYFFQIMSHINFDFIGTFSNFQIAFSKSRDIRQIPC